MNIETVELISCLIQLFVLLTLIWWSARQTDEPRVFQTIMCAFGCYFLGALFWTLHLFIMSDWPRGFSASDLACIGYYCFFIASVMGLKPTMTFDEKTRVKRARFAALIGPAVVIAFHTVYVLLAGGLVNNILYCIPLSFLFYHALLGAITGGRNRRYHTAVLTVFMLELIIFLVSSFGYDPLYLVFTYIQMAAWFFIVPAAKTSCYPQVDPNSNADFDEDCSCGNRVTE